MKDVFELRTIVFSMVSTFKPSLHLYTLCAMKVDPIDSNRPKSVVSRSRPSFRIWRRRSVAVVWRLQVAKK
jgi:hypothetical protein